MHYRCVKGKKRQRFCHGFCSPRNGLYTENLIPPGGKLKFLTYFWLFRPPEASNHISCFIPSKAESHSAFFWCRSISVLGQCTHLKFGGAKWKLPSFFMPSGQALHFLQKTRQKAHIKDCQQQSLLQAQLENLCSNLPKPSTRWHPGWLCYKWIIYLTASPTAKTSEV